jgi:hypothetical protein
MAKDANGYPAGSMRAALPAIAYTLRAFRVRLIYGSSMGAYAAIKYSRLLGATHESRSGCMFAARTCVSL